MCRADRRTQATSQSQIPKLLQLIVKKTIIVLGAVPYCIFASKKIALPLLREYVKSLPDLKNPFIGITGTPRDWGPRLTIY
jgi:hypothetical protein